MKISKTLMRQASLLAKANGYAAQRKLNKKEFKSEVERLKRPVTSCSWGEGDLVTFKDTNAADTGTLGLKSGIVLGQTATRCLGTSLWFDVMFDGRIMPIFGTKLRKA